MTLPLSCGALVVCGIAMNAPSNRSSDSQVVRAAMAGKIKQLQKVCSRGCNIDAADGEPIRIAASRGDAEMVEFLLQNGASVNAPDPQNRETALILASRAGRPQVVRRLLESGANINHCSDDVTALGAASARGHLDTVRLLLASGAAIDLSCGSADTPLQLAINGKAKWVADLLQDRGGSTTTGLQFEDELIVVPRGYTGVVAVIYDRRYGSDVPREESQRIYRVDASGVLCADVLSQSPRREINRSVVVTSADGGRRPLAQLGLEAGPFVTGTAANGLRYLATIIGKPAEKVDPRGITDRIDTLSQADHCRGEATKRRTKLN